ncbi:MAG: hypothetical protein WHT47_05240 [Hydrogenothermaceae bacterium]
MHKRDILIAIIKAIGDYYRGIYGKVNLTFKKPSEIKRELNLSRDLKKDIEELESYLYSKPKDLENLIKFFVSVITKKIADLSSY